MLQSMSSNTNTLLAKNLQFGEIWRLGDLADTLPYSLNLPISAILEATLRPALPLKESSCCTTARPNFPAVLVEEKKNNRAVILVMFGQAT